VRPVRHEVRRVASGLAVLLSMPGLLAMDRPNKPKEAAAEVGPISAALCGRGQRNREQAEALDEFKSPELPPIWQKETVETLRSWLKAQICLKASGKEVDRFQSRRRVLEELERRLTRAEGREQIGATLAPFRSRKPSPEEWPSDVDCEACAALRSSAATVADIASQWQPQKATQLGSLLKTATQWEALVAELCAAQPPLNARAEIERKFRYYSWTASAARLFEVAALFAKPEIAAECRGR
jgi:hypothetical protein